MRGLVPPPPLPLLWPVLGCSHCHDLAPAWRNFGTAMDGVIGVGAVNCQEAWDVCQNLGIRSYPTIIKMSEGESQEHFHGGRSVEGFAEFGLGGFAMPSALSRHTFERLKTQDMPSLIVVCDNMVYDCESAVELQKISAVVHGIVNVFSLECQWERELCQENGIERPQALYIEKGKAINKFYPPTDEAGDQEDWAETYDAVKLGHAVIALLPLPKTMPGAIFSYMISDGKLSSNAMGDMSQLSWSTISTTAACENNQEVRSLAAVSHLTPCPYHVNTMTLPLSKRTGMFCGVVSVPGCVFPYNHRTVLRTLPKLMPLCFYNGIAGHRTE